MKLLLDANISWKLCSLLTPHFGECTHVNKTSLPVPAADTRIWNYARENGCIIVTQDSDFLNLLQAKGYPPKIILLRTGNISTQEAERILLQAKSSIEELDQKDLGLLEIW